MDMCLYVNMSFNLIFTKYISPIRDMAIYKLEI